MKLTSDLTDQEHLFVAEYLVDRNATAAARRAGYRDPATGPALIDDNLQPILRRYQEHLSEYLQAELEQMVGQGMAASLPEKTAAKRGSTKVSRKMVTPTASVPITLG